MDPLLMFHEEMDGLWPSFMDKELGKDLVADKIRESLIAISYGVPDSEPNAERPQEQHVQGEEVVKPIVKEGDKDYRSELISISESPDAKSLPVLRAELDTIV